MRIFCYDTTYIGFLLLQRYYAMCSHAAHAAAVMLQIIDCLKYLAFVAPSTGQNGLELLPEYRKHQWMA